VEQNTPEEEAKLVNRFDGNINIFKFIMDKIRLYKGFSVNDVLVNKEKKSKYKITYIDENYGFIYGRRICATGKLSNQLQHLTNHNAIYTLDVKQINAILLGGKYDPGAEAKAISKRKRIAAVKRQKERAVIKQGREYEWAIANLKIGQEFWAPYTDEDRKALNYKLTVISLINCNGITVTHKNKKNFLLYYNDFKEYNFYLTKPTIYKEHGEI